MENWTSIQSTVYGNPELSSKMRHIAYKQMLLTELVDPSDEFYLGKRSGDQIAYRLVGRISGTAHTPLTEFTTVPVGNVPEYTGTAYVYRYAYGVSWTSSREDLDRMDVHDMTAVALREHMQRTTNKLIYDVLNAGKSFCYVPLTATTANWTTNGTPTGTRAYDLTLWHLRNLAKEHASVNVPPMDGRNYFLVPSPNDYFGILQDSAANGYVDVAKYGTRGVDGILNNELGKVANFRIIGYDNDVLPDAIGSSSLYGTSVIAGAGACKEMVVYPAHFRFQDNVGSDFGNASALAWQMLMGWVVCWNYTLHGQASLTFVTSA